MLFNDDDFHARASKQIAEEHPGWPTAIDQSTQVDGAGVAMTLKVYCKSATDASNVQSDIIDQATTWFRENKISLAIPITFTQNPASQGQLSK